MPNVKKAYERFGDDGLVVIGISFDDRAETVRRFAKQRDVSWPQVLAERGAQGPLAEAYGVAGIPATFLVGPDGKVVAKDLRGKKLLSAIEKEMDKLKKGDEDRVAAADGS